MFEGKITKGHSRNIPGSLIIGHEASRLDEEEQEDQGLVTNANENLPNREVEHGDGGEEDFVVRPSPAEKRRIVNNPKLGSFQEQGKRELAYFAYQPLTTLIDAGITTPSMLTTRCIPRLMPHSSSGFPRFFPPKNHP